MHDNMYLLKNKDKNLKVWEINETYFLEYLI